MSAGRTQQRARLAYAFLRIILFVAFSFAVVSVFFVKPSVIAPLAIVAALILWQLWGLRNK